MAIARRLVTEALERREGDERVTDVEVVLGAATRLSAEAVRQHFELAALDTPSSAWTERSSRTSAAVR